MQKWEYLEVHLRASGPDYRSVTLSLNGEVSIHDNIDVNTVRLIVLDDLGQQGWQLVQGDEHVLTLKRPK